MTEGRRKPSKLLAVADASETQSAVQAAVAFADVHGAALEVIACVEPPQDFSILSRLSGAAPDQLLEEAVERVRTDIGSHLAELWPDRALPVTVAVGKPFLEIIRHVARSGCDFVVKTGEPLTGIDRFLFSSTDQHLLRKCPCPVWLLTPSVQRSPRCILAAVDLDVSDAAEPETLMALNRRVVDAACLLAAAPEAEVIVLHAWDAMGEGMVWAFSSGSQARLSAEAYVNEILDARHRAMERLLAEVRKDLGPQPRLVPRMARGIPETVIHEQSRRVGADVVVMGTVARTGLSGVFIGNTAENIINSLECPILAVKPEGFVSPLLPG